MTTVERRQRVRFVSLLVLLWVGLALLPTGCGKGADACFVSGEVSYDGKPVEDGAIRFDRIGGETSVVGKGRIIDGKYSLPLSEGMVAGEYQVAIYANRKTDTPMKAFEQLAGETAALVEVEQFIPPRYNAETKLKVKLQPGENKGRNFDLDKQAEATEDPARTPG